MSAYNTPNKKKHDFAAAISKQADIEATEAVQKMNFEVKSQELIFLVQKLNCDNTNSTLDNFVELYDTLVKDFEDNSINGATVVYLGLGMKAVTVSEAQTIDKWNEIKGLVQEMLNPVLEKKAEVRSKYINAQYEKNPHLKPGEDIKPLIITNPIIA